MTIHDVLVATSNHHGGGNHPFTHSAVRGAGYGAGRDTEHLAFSQLEHLLGPGLMIAAILAVVVVVAVLMHRAKNRGAEPASAA